MSFFPFNPNIELARRMQSDVPGLYVRRMHGVRYSLTAAEAAVADVDYFVTSTNMKVGAYTLAATSMPGACARNVTVTQTAAGNEDTNGTITVTGTNLAGETISEAIVPNAGATVAGAKAFRTVTSVVGAGWVIDQGNDTITVGFGDAIGLPDLLETNTVLLAALAGAKEAVAPTVATSTAHLEGNTVDLNSALNGSAVDIYYVV